MISDLFEKEVKKEERLFLSLCSQKDKQKVTQKIPMTFHDYLRITCIISNLRLFDYEVKIGEDFPKYHEMKKEMLKRHEDILREYPDYYKDEAFDKKEQNWLLEFCSQIPDTCLQKKYAKKFGLKAQEKPDKI